MQTATQTTAEYAAPPTRPSPITLTAKALEVIKSTMEKEEMKDHALRVGVQGGGCAGLQYSLDLEKDSSDADFVFDIEGVKVFIDPLSAEYLNGATVDYVETAYASGFSFSNPTVKKTCGCGSSFSV